MREWPHRDVILLGVAVAAVNLFFYAALDRLPLGITVTLEFVGPLGVAIARLAAAARRRSGCCSPRSGSSSSPTAAAASVDALGVVLALTAGAFWGAYIVLSDRVGDLAPGAGGATMAAVISAVLVAPLGIAQGGGEIFDPRHLADRRRGRRPQHRDPLRLRDRGAAAPAAGGLRGADEPRAGGRSAIGFLALSQDLDAVEVLAIPS